MSRMTLCLLTAALLGLLSGGTMYLRSWVLGDEVSRPIGPDTWRVVLSANGVSDGNPRVWVPTPLHLDRQRLVDELFSSDKLSPRSPDETRAGRRRVAFAGSAAAGVRFSARCEYLIGIKPRRTAGPAANVNPAHYAAPRPGDHLGDEPAIESSHEAISARSGELTTVLSPAHGPLDIAQALYRFAEQHVRVDGESVTALTCLQTGKGDRLARARLLVALLRSREIPARVVQGLTLTRGPEQTAHHWVEAFLFDHWVPMCPTYRHFGKVPSTFLVLGFGDRAAVTGRRVKELRHTFLVERLDREGAAPETGWRRAMKAVSLYQLPPGDRRLVEVLLMLPVAALIVCVFRNVIGLNSFGTFTPALIGLAFHDLNSLPGLGVFVLILMVGWGMRRWLDHYHLLQVPRTAMMLTLIMTVLIVFVVASNSVGATTTRYLSLFPMVILTGMVERFWTQETEDGAMASFKTLLQTLVMAMTIAFVLSRPWLVRHLFCYPETLGLVMAGQLLIGRYTGYRVTELFRFRDFLRDDVGYTTA